MRTFKDSSGTEWTVFEVRRANEESNWAYLPRGFRSGWLCFESTAGKRRLSPVPDGWKLLEPPDLIAMLGRATMVGRSGRSDGPHDSARRFPRGDSEANA
jgi:hypothetical protein